MANFLRPVAQEAAAGVVNGELIVVGTAGGDFLFGGLGDDVLLGGLGDDWLFGGPGVDDLDGGPGRNLLFP